MGVSGKTACELASAGLGATFMAVASGVTGGTLTAPAIVVGGAVGYVIGRAICRIPALQMAFDNLFDSGDWSALDLAIKDPDIRAQAIAVTVSEVGLSEERAKEVWEVIESAIDNRNRSAFEDQSVKQAMYHPANGAAAHGLSVLRGSVNV